MSKPKRYQVQNMPGGGELAVEGLEFLADSPIGRRIYRHGEIVELAEGAVNVERLIGLGIIHTYVGSDALVRPAFCPACQIAFVNQAGAAATCNHCGADWPPLELEMDKIGGA